MEDLRQFINTLEREGDIVRVTAPVDSKLEIAEVHRRVIAADGPALLFTNVKGSQFPVATNLFGTKKRVELAFGTEALRFMQTIKELPHTMLPPSLGKVWAQRGFLRRLLKVGFKTRCRNPWPEEIPGADLTKLPALTSWSEDGGPFLTLPLVHTQGQHPGEENLGMYRVQIHEPTEAGMHFQIGKGGGFHLFEAEQAGRDMSTNIYLGGPPALILSAIAPLPENLPELLLTSILLNQRLKRAKLPGVLPNPVASAEFCLTGHVPARVRRPEGPFGDHYGYYSLVHDYPVFRPKRILHRTGAIFPATVVGKPRQEDFYLGDYLQELLSPMIPLAMPGVIDLWSYGEAGYHPLSVARLRERYEREMRSTMFRILGEGQLALTKFLIAVDQGIDIRSFRTVLSHVLERIDWERDLYIFSHLSMDSLDYAGQEINKGSKGVMIGTGPVRRRLLHEFTGLVSDTRVKDVRVYSPGCLVVGIPGYAEDPGVVKALSALPEFADWPLIIAVDDVKRTLKSDISLIWTAFTRFEPAADLHAKRTYLVGNQVKYEGPLTLDARMKPWYPKELFCDPTTARQVTQRWSEYFPSGVAMGSSDDAHL